MIDRYKNIVQFVHIQQPHLKHWNNRMISEKKRFDLTFLEEMEDKNFLVEVIVLYLKDTDNDLSQMKASFDENDFEAIYKGAHKLKSSTGMLQANTLYAVLENIEKLARSQEDNNQLVKLVEMAKSEFHELKASLELYLQEINTPVGGL